MTAATVSVAFVNPPKPGKKLGSIKADDGAYYWARGDMLANFQRGKTYKIDYKTSDDGQWKTIESFENATQANNTYRETSSTDAERMFVCKIMGDYITAGKVDLNEQSIVSVINCLRKAWRQTFGSKLSVSLEMNGDELPDEFR